MDNVLIQDSSVLTSSKDIQAQSDESYSNVGQLYSWGGDLSESGKSSGYSGSVTVSGITGPNIACYDKKPALLIQI